MTPGTAHPLVGTDAEVYFNVKTSLWSIRSGGKVVGYSDLVVVTDAVLFVQPAGRDKVRETGQKNVHAGVRGTLAFVADDVIVIGEEEEALLMRVQSFFADLDQKSVRLFYDPKVVDGFVTHVGHLPVTRADQVLLGYSRIYAKNLTQPGYKHEHAAR